MSEPIKNRYDFVILFDVENGNPNGDPDAGNMPRIDPETGYGLVTDVCLKRKIRNYVETLKEDEKGYRIYIKDGVPLNRSDAEAIKTLGIDPDLKAAKKADPDIDAKLRDYMCENYFDIRTFGAVMTTFVKGALNCGQVRGPVQLSFARSVDPIVPQEVTITRVAITTEADAEKKGTEMGRKHIVPYALYRAEGYVVREFPGYRYVAEVKEHLQNLGHHKRQAEQKYVLPQRACCHLYRTRLCIHFISLSMNFLFSSAAEAPLPLPARISYHFRRELSSAHCAGA